MTMADSIDYSLSFGSIPRAPSREAVKLTLQAEMLRSRAQRELTLRQRDPWRGRSASREEPDEVQCYDYWEEIV